MQFNVILITLSLIFHTFPSLLKVLLYVLLCLGLHFLLLILWNPPPRDGIVHPEPICTTHGDVVPSPPTQLAQEVASVTFPDRTLATSEADLRHGTRVLPFLQTHVVGSRAVGHNVSAVLAHKALHLGAHGGGYSETNKNIYILIYRAFTTEALCLLTLWFQMQYRTETRHSDNIAFTCRFLLNSQM